MCVFRLWGRVAAALIAFVLAAPLQAQTLTPVTPQPAAGVLADGLAVKYWENLFELISELESWMQSAKGEEGPPIPELNYHVGEGKVLTSNYINFVGAHIEGLMHIEKPGKYEFEVTSNDGIKIMLGGQQIYINPGVHPDWVSEPIPVEIGSAGWYPIEVFYFEKKYTSTIILKWKPPGADIFQVVPASQFKHIAG
jgi:hypothetical protein